MSLFRLFRGGKKELSAPSSASRVVDENGEPAIKLYPAQARGIPSSEHRDLILAVAIVADDVQREGATIGKFRTFMAKEQGAIAYFAPVGLMPAGDGEFFVNYRGCLRL